ncbi:MAG: ATP-binding protein [Candidatus Moranbacteria bacterium]|jgi:signal transduction histidine kinase|nr:ATP-binding protein [Candidatus Moranbacteria bacterium]
MICPSYSDPIYFLFSTDVPALLYYSHFTAIGISLLLGFFVFLKNRQSLEAKILFLISICFSFWAFINLITWTNNESSLIMFVWSFFGLFFSLICILSFYFAYVFVNKKDLPMKIKILLALMFFPIILFLPTRYALMKFHTSLCGVEEGFYYTNYYYILGLIIFFWNLIILSKGYLKSDYNFRKQILIFGTGIELFLLSFFSSGYIASLFLENSYNVEFVGLFFMTFFMGMLTYMIVRFKTFNIKLIGAEALVVSLFILVAAQFAFIRNPINMILNGVALFLITIFGYILIRGVKREIAQKEALAIANEEISERKDQLQKISDHLAIANDKLKELDTAKTEFVSIVAHQLQGPPTTVKGYSTLLLEGSYGEINAEQKDVLQKIFNANEQQIEFVNDLLSVSRLESGRVMFDFDNCQIQEICQEVIDNLFIKAKDKGLYLELIKSDELIPEVKIDRAKIKEAITNLVDNAVKYTKRGGVNISLQVCSLKNDKCLPNNHLRITVSDTGIGIPADEMPRMFSKFSRGKDVKRLNAGGTGLGLYVVKMIVEGNKGQVWIESDGNNKGSRFIIELPIA